MVAAAFKTRSSHVRTFESCGRKWFLNEVVGLPDPDTYAKTFGTAAHWQREQWLKHARMPDDTKPGQAAKRGLKHLPAPGAGLLVEHPIERVLLDGTIYTGAIDLADLRPMGTLLRSLGLSGLRLYDHKFTASLRYAKTADELSRDVSAVFYAMEVRRLLREAGAEEEVIHGRWLYGERDSTKVKPVDFTITRANQRERWAQTLGSVKEMRGLAEQVPGSSWTDVTPNYDACNAFGGCPFRDKCTLAKFKAVGAAKGEQAKMGLLDDLKSKKPIGDKVAAPQATNAPTASTKPSLASLLKKPTPVAVEEVLEPEEPEPTDESPQADEPTEAELEGEGVAVGIVPPDAPPPDLQKDTVEKKTRKKREKTLEQVASPAAGALPDAAEVARQLVAASKPLSAAIELAVASKDSTRTNIVRGLRARAEDLTKGNTLGGVERSNELFVIANMIERNEI